MEKHLESINIVNRDLYQIQSEFWLPKFSDTDNSKKENFINDFIKIIKVDPIELMQIYTKNEP